MRATIFKLIFASFFLMGITHADEKHYSASQSKFASYEKTYIQPHQIAITHEGIFFQLNGEWIPIESVHDAREILDFNPLLMRLPSFAANPNTAETKWLKDKYQQQYREIIHRYKDKDFLEVTLTQMGSE